MFYGKRGDAHHSAPFDMAAEHQAAVRYTDTLGGIETARDGKNHPGEGLITLAIAHEGATVTFKQQLRQGRKAGPQTRFQDRHYSPALRQTLTGFSEKVHYYGVRQVMQEAEGYDRIKIPQRLGGPVLHPTQGEISALAIGGPRPLQVLRTGIKPHIGHALGHISQEFARAAAHIEHTPTGARRQMHLNKPPAQDLTANGPGKQTVDRRKLQEAAERA
jgi:hypothetical protein